MLQLVWENLTSRTAGWVMGTTEGLSSGEAESSLLWKGLCSGWIGGKEPPQGRDQAAA